MSCAFSRLLDVDFIVLFIAYLFVSRGETGAGVFAFCQGLLTDIFSGGFLGLFGLLYLGIFLGITWHFLHSVFKASHNSLDNGNILYRLRKFLSAG